MNCSKRCTIMFYKIDRIKAIQMKLYRQFVFLCQTTLRKIFDTLFAAFLKFSSSFLVM